MHCISIPMPEGEEWCFPVGGKRMESVGAMMVFYKEAVQ